MIIYRYKKGAIFVYLDDRRVGTILSVMKDNRYHYTYYPLHINDHGEVFQTIQEVKDSLEGCTQYRHPVTA